MERTGRYEPRPVVQVEPGEDQVTPRAVVDAWLGDFELAAAPAPTAAERARASAARGADVVIV